MIDDLELARTLLEQGIANRDQLRQARQLQLTQDTTLYLAMIEHDIISEPQLVEVAAGLLNVPFVTLADREVPAEVARLVPVDMARTHGVLPLELREDAQGELLLLAMRDPLDIMAMDDISTHVNVGIQPILCGPKDLFQAIERAQNAQISLSMPRDNSVDFGEFSTPAEHEQDSLSTEDSWAVFFDDALSQPEPGDARAMRDRPNSTMALELMDIDEILEADDAPEKDPVSLLDEPGEPSSVEMDALNGWEVDSSLGSKHSSPPPPPLPTSASPPSSFDALHAAIDLDDDDPAPSGTLIAGPSMSLTGEHDVAELTSGLVDDQDVLDADDALSGMVESEVLGEAPSVAEAMDDQESLEPMISDEAGSQTQMGNIGQMLAGTSEARDPKLATHDRVLSLNDGNQGSFTTLGTPKRLNADGTERPMLVIKSDGEDLFSQALADIDARDEDSSPASGKDQSASDDEEAGDASLDAQAAIDAQEDAEEDAEEDEPRAALGRLKLKRVAVPRQGLLDVPVVERSRVVEQEGVAIQGTSETDEARSLDLKDATQAADDETAMRDILDDDDILAGFQAALDDEEQEEQERERSETSLADEETRASGTEGLDATREFDAASLFDFTGDGEDGLDEATSAAMGEAHARIERLNKMIRNANHSARGEQLEELGAQGTDGEIDAPAAGMRVVQSTRSNQAITQDSLKKMRQSTMDLSSDLLFSGTNSPGLPADVDDSRLLRAALMILISQDLIKIDELIALAKSLPSR